MLSPAVIEQYLINSLQPEKQNFRPDKKRRIILVQFDKTI